MYKMTVRTTLKAEIDQFDSGTSRTSRNSQSRDRGLSLTNAAAYKHGVKSVKSSRDADSTDRINEHVELAVMEAYPGSGGPGRPQLPGHTCSTVA